MEWIILTIVAIISTAAFQVINQYAREGANILAGLGAVFSVIVLVILQDL